MSESKTASKGGGLENVAAADSAICKIDGSVGELRYRGYLIKDLADKSDFVETSYMLIHGDLPKAKELDDFRQKLASKRELGDMLLELLQPVVTKMPPMDFLRTAVSALAAEDPNSRDNSQEKNLDRGLGLIAKLPTIVAAYARLRQGKEPLKPRADLDHSANFLYMLNGEEPKPEVAKMLDVCLVLHAEHGFNASTFSARVTAATLSDIYSAITSAVGTLKGPLHGGANSAVMEMLQDIGSVDKVESHIDDLLARKEKIMGFGHRVYKVVDPRALILRGFSERLAKETGEPKWFEMSKKIEETMKAKKGIDMNVDFYSASTYYYMGIVPDLFTCIFAISRISGWVAHVLEQYANNRLIRPRANWVGIDARDYVPIGDR